MTTTPPTPPGPSAETVEAFASTPEGEAILGWCPACAGRGEVEAQTPEGPDTATCSECRGTGER